MGKTALKMECSVLFQANPSRALTVDEIQRKLRKTKIELDPVLTLLMKQGIVKRVDNSGNESYRYQEPVTILQMDGTDRKGRS
ncbi:helix-turn-helix domain-containing protein [Virgibacillus senegalensis]|uniref:hypothetical protein n=1 Tax=Virgibacillus senegalensis TaxID=1499679 RepID=UPI00069F0660|nr:hypothetical protein [Virgibacillus senegalensis]